MAKAIAARPRVGAVESLLELLLVDEAGIEVVVRLLVEPATAPFPLPFPPFLFSSAARWVEAMSSASIPCEASTWWRRSSVPAAVRGRSSVSTRSSPSIRPYRTFQREDGSVRPAPISSSACSRAARRAVPGASAEDGSSSASRKGRAPGRGAGRCRSQVFRFVRQQGRGSRGFVQCSTYCGAAPPRVDARLFIRRAVPSEHTSGCGRGSGYRPTSASGRPTMRCETPV